MKEHVESEWKELVERKDEFLHILRILNHYYETKGQTESQLYQFRRDLVDRSPESIRIFLSQIGTYEYFVQASLSLGTDAMETWVHIDGIAEERDRLREIGNLEHPVFSITCLGDLMQNHTRPFKIPLTAKKKVAKPRKVVKL